MPIRAFWGMSNMIARVAAEDDIRSLSIAVYAQSGEGAQEYRKKLDGAVGTVVQEDNTFDLDGWSALKSLAG